jgi:hypothetical protein
MFTHDDGESFADFVLGGGNPADYYGNGDDDTPRWCAIDRAPGDQLRGALRDVRAELAEHARRFARGEITEAELLVGARQLGATERELLGQLGAPVPIEHHVTIDDLAARTGLTVIYCAEHDSAPPGYGERDDAVPDHDCPRDAFLADPITRYYGVGGEMLHLISCPVCEARERDQ